MTKSLQLRGRGPTADGPAVWLRPAAALAPCLVAPPKRRGKAPHRSAQVAARTRVARQDSASRIDAPEWQSWPLPRAWPGGGRALLARANSQPLTADRYAAAGPTRVGEAPWLRPASALAPYLVAPPKKRGRAQRRSAQVAGRTRVARQDSVSRMTATVRRSWSLPRAVPRVRRGTG